ARVRTCRISSRMPPYWTGISQPRKSTSLAWASTWAAWSGVVRKGPSSRRRGAGTYHASPWLPRRAVSRGARGLPLRAPTSDAERRRDLHVDRRRRRDQRQRRGRLLVRAAERMPERRDELEVGGEPLGREQRLRPGLREPEDVRHRHERGPDRPLRDGQRDRR